MKTLLLIISPLVIQAIVFKELLDQASYKIATALSLLCNILSYFFIAMSVFIVCGCRANSFITPLAIALCTNFIFYIITLLVLKTLFGYPFSEIYLPILIGYCVTAIMMALGLFLNDYRH